MRVVGVAQPFRDLIVDLVGIGDFEVLHPDLRRSMHYRLKALGLVRARSRNGQHGGNAVADVDIPTRPPQVREPAPRSKQYGSSTRAPRLAESVDHIGHPSIDCKAARMSVEELP
jgi:hypothetical protein